MKATHTPGPWEITTGSRPGDMPWHCVSSGFTVVAHVAPRMISTNPDESKANARLIAAAPELLKALECLTGLIRDCHNVYDTHAATWIINQPSFIHAEQAIAKARETS